MIQDNNLEADTIFSAPHSSYIVLAAMLQWRLAHLQGRGTSGLPSATSVEGVQ